VVSSRTLLVLRRQMFEGKLKVIIRLMAHMGRNRSKGTRTGGAATGYHGGANQAGGVAWRIRRAPVNSTKGPGPERRDHQRGDNLGIREIQAHTSRSRRVVWGSYSAEPGYVRPLKTRAPHVGDRGAEDP